MAQRKTRKAGLPQSRHSDPKLQRTLDAIIERLEVIDGLRGDALDRAVTYRDLSLSGFTVTDNLSITNTPGPGTGGPGTTPGGGDGPGIGPAAAPTNLAAAETFLAIMLTWDNPSFNLQHIEVWRADTDNLSLATMIGTTVSPQYVDYVGASASYYYWVRAVGTDGTFSAFNDTQGTLGTTGVDPSDWELNLNISASNLDAALAARIDLIDVDGVIDSLMTRVAAAQGDIIAIDSRTTSLESDLTDANVLISGNTAVTTANASLLSTQQTSITQLLNDLGVAQGDITDNASAITVNASDILNLQASLGALDADGGQTWDFLTDLDGWTASNASLTHSGEGTGLVRFTPSGANPYMSSDAISIGGGIYTQVVARVRRNAGGGTWEGKVSYSTAGHGIGSYYKLIPDPTLLNGQWQTLTWDMATVEGASTSDWVDSTITALQLELVSDAGGSFDIDWVIIAKFSTTAITEAISALDVRVTNNEGDISSQGTSLTNLSSAVNDNQTGLAATADALDALTTTVTVTQAGLITANAAAITALDTKVYDPVLGTVAQSSAFTQLQADVSAVEGVNTAQSSDLTQLVARMSGSYASIVNPLTTVGENFGTDYSAAELQAFNVGGRTGVCARVATAGNASDSVYRHDGARIQVNPNDIYEVKFSVYHGRATDAGTFFAGLSSYVAASGGSGVAVRAINDRVAGTTTTNPYWLSFAGANHDEEWLDVTCYILGADVDASVCPNMLINGSSATTGYAVFNDGFKVVSGAFVHLRFLNYNGVGYGDSSTTTTYVTDLQVRRIDSEAENYAALQVQANVTANDIDDLNALYAVNVELNAGGVPYVTGFGLAAHVIDGVATSAFGIRADQFFITSPSNPVDTAVPFGIGIVDGSATVGIRGELIVDGTIRGTSIVAGDIGADQITVNNLSALSADMGTLTAGLMRTAASPAWRVEIQDTAGANEWPIWYGSNAKSAGNGLFYVTNAGDVVVKGLLDAGMIKQSYFTPAGSNNSFRIACDYPSNYSGGVYTGKKAHINPVLTTGYVAPQNSYGTVIIASSPTNNAQSKTQLNTGYNTAALRWYSPTNSSTYEYGRLGSLSETLVVRYAANVSNEFSDQQFWAILQYRYDAGTWRNAYVLHTKAPRGARFASMSAEDVFITRDTAWDTLDIRLGLGCEWLDATFRGTAQTVNLTVETANFGYADLASQETIDSVTGSTQGSTTIVRDPTKFRQYL